MTAAPITKAMLFAAGFGTRLRPYTLTTPKPLLPIGGRPLIDFSLEKIAAAGIHDVMINLHYLPDAIRAHVGDGRSFGLHAHYSLETPCILGTGGGLRRVADFFGEADFLIMNADVLTDLDLIALLQKHTGARHPAATLAIRRLQPGESFTPLTLNPDQSLHSFGAGDFHYTGIMIGTPKLLQILPAQGPSCLIRQGVIPLLERSEIIETFAHDGAWNDIGTVAAYEGIGSYSLFP